MQQLTAISESDCCGNGCANCILDPNTRKINIPDEGGKRNLIVEYNKYKLMSRNCLPRTDILDLHFKCADMSKSAGHILQIPAGHHVMMRAPIIRDVKNSGSNFLLRPYSPYWVDVTNLEFKILVNLKPNGLMSQYIRDLQHNDEVEFRGTIGNFEHTAKADETQFIFIVTQGIAIAPVVRVIEEILCSEEDISRIFLFACFSNLEQILFRDRIQNYNGYWNFKGKIYLSRQNCGTSDCFLSGCTDDCERFQKSLRYKEEVFCHRLCNKDLQNICKQANGIEKKILLCGTRSFQDQLAKLVKALPIDVKEKDIYKF